MPSDGITYSKFLLPGIFYAIPMHDIFAKVTENVEIAEPKTTPVKTEFSVPALVLSNAPEVH